MKRKKTAKHTTRTREDKDAIMARRRFLIRAALATVGAGALASGCGRAFEPCLKPARVEHRQPGSETLKPEVCLQVSVRPPATNQTSVAPQPCLSAPPPRACLDVILKPEKNSQDVSSRPCLTVVREETK